VSTLHANYIINKGTATASDVLKVIDHVRKTVAKKTGVTLEARVQNHRHVSYFAHESSYVDDGAVIGDGTQNLALFARDARARDRRALQPRPERRRDARHQNRQQCKIQNNVSIYEGVELEDDVFAASSSSPM